MFVSSGVPEVVLPPALETTLLVVVATFPTCVMVSDGFAAVALEINSIVIV